MNLDKSEEEYRKDIQGIQTSFKLITDNFVNKYMKYLETKDKTEVDEIYKNIQSLGSEAYLLENNIISKSEISYMSSNRIDDQNRELKMENEEMENKLDKIASKIDTAEESYGEELQSYRESVLTILLYLTMYILGIKLFLGLGLSRNNSIMFTVIFLLFAIIFHIRSVWVYGILVILMIYFRKYLYSRIKSAV